MKTVTCTAPRGERARGVAHVYDAQQDEAHLLLPCKSGKAHGLGWVAFASASVMVASPRAFLPRSSTRQNRQTDFLSVDIRVTGHVVINPIAHTRSSWKTL